MTLLVQSSGSPLSLAPAIRSTVASLDASLPIFDVRTMDEHLRNGQAFLFTRIGAAFASVFGLLALVLAMIGVYGVVSYAVAQRTREIGIRIALGASASGVLRLVVRQGMVPAVLGVLVGLVGALAVTRLMSGLLYGVSATDPITFALVTIVLTLVALVACVVPARRAARVDPVVALRSE
jgi:ABC-type antimicrobial peptide transport system permease subunit